jgi:hypothetical protein
MGRLGTGQGRRDALGGNSSFSRWRAPRGNRVRFAQVGAPDGGVAPLDPCRPLGQRSFVPDPPGLFHIAEARAATVFDEITLLLGGGAGSQRS